MPLDVSLFRTSLNLKHSNPEISMYQQTAGVRKNLDLLDFFIMYDLLMHYRLLHVYVKDCYKAFLI